MVFLSFSGSTATHLFLIKASPSDSSRIFFASLREIFVSPRRSWGLKSKIASSPRKDGFVPPILISSLTPEDLPFHQSGILHRIPDSSYMETSFKNKRASPEDHARGWNSSPVSTSCETSSLFSAARVTVERSSSIFLPRLPYSLIAFFRGRCFDLPLSFKPFEYVARNANGKSSSLFSTR